MHFVFSSIYISANNFNYKKFIYFFIYLFICDQTLTALKAVQNIKNQDQVMHLPPDPVHQEAVYSLGALRYPNSELFFRVRRA